MAVCTQGPFHCVVEKFVNCQLGEQGYDGALRFYVRHSRYNPGKKFEPQYVTGNQTNGLDIDDTFWVMNDSLRQQGPQLFPLLGCGL